MHPPWGITRELVLFSNFEKCVRFLLNKLQYKDKFGRRRAEHWGEQVTWISKKTPQGKTCLEPPGSRPRWSSSGCRPLLTLGKALASSCSTARERFCSESAGRAHGPQSCHHSKSHSKCRFYFLGDSDFATLRKSQVFISWYRTSNLWQQGGKGTIGLKVSMTSHWKYAQICLWSFVSFSSIVKDNPKKCLKLQKSEGYCMETSDVTWPPVLQPQSLAQCHQVILETSGWGDYHIQLQRCNMYLLSSYNQSICILFIMEVSFHYFYLQK